MRQLPLICRSTAILLVAALAALATQGCETTAPYVSCALDKEVTDKGICTGTDSNTSCVVRRHPQCDQAVCLSYYSMPAICTQACVTDADCPADGMGTGTCWTFAPADTVSGKAAEKYCISATLKADKVAADAKKKP